MTKFVRKSTFLCLLLVLAFITPTFATDQPLADKVVGFWVSSSGAELRISYSGDPQKAWLSVNGGADIDLWLAGGARGGTSVDYTSADGDTIHGSLNGDGTITVQNKSGSFKSTWRRR